MNKNKIYLITIISVIILVGGFIFSTFLRKKPSEIIDSYRTSNPNSYQLPEGVTNIPTKQSSDIKHPELDLYREYLSNDKWIDEYQSDSPYKEMAVFDLYNDNIFEVFYMYTGSDFGNYTTGFLTYSNENGLIVNQEFAKEHNNVAYYVSFISEKNGTIFKSPTRGKSKYLYENLNSDGTFSELDVFGTCYLSMDETEMYGWTSKRYGEYSQIAKDMVQPNFVPITEENIQLYLCGEGKTTGINKAIYPATR